MRLLPTEESLIQVVSKRLKTAGPYAQYCVDEAAEVIVFGSMSVGLDRSDSDVDVLCISGRDYKLKTNSLDLIVVSLDEMSRSKWLQSELASHVGEYGK